MAGRLRALARLAALVLVLGGVWVAAIQAIAALVLCLGLFLVLVGDRARRLFAIVLVHVWSLPDLMWSLHKLANPPAERWRAGS